MPSPRRAGQRDASTSLPIQGAKVVSLLLAGMVETGSNAQLINEATLCFSVGVKPLS